MRQNTWVSSFIWVACFLLLASGLPAHAAEPTGDEDQPSVSNETGGPSAPTDESCAVCPIPPHEHSITIEKGAECPVCGMYIQRFKDTAFEVFFKDGKRGLYCGVVCGLRVINDVGGLDNVKQAFATDWVSKKAVDISNAHYVIGSKIIPDMVPSIIAFASEDEARQFMSEQGGRLVPLRDLLKIISPFGQTVPFRIPPAATPPQGVFSTALGVNVASSTTLMSGNDEVDDRRGSPKEQQTVGTNLRLLYALTDDLVMETAVTRFSKDLTVIRPNGTEFERDEAGLGDVDLIFRWRLYRDDFFDKHFALLLGTTLPTGHFEKGLPPGLQLGTGAPSLSVGPLYSQHIGAFWLHGSLVYKYNFENNDDVQSGDSLQGGVAVHYTHNYDQMVGLEVDGTATSKTQTNGADTPNTGRTNVFANAVAHWPSRPVLGRQFQHPGLGGCPAL